jgi:hypothetical protein
MGRLFDGVAEIDRVIASRGLDAIRTKGQIGMNAGFFLAIVFPDTPDDPVRIDKLKQAAQDVLGVSLNI